MCGRYGLTVSKKELIERYHLDQDSYTLGDYSFEEKEEIFPTTSNIILLPNKKLYPIKCCLLYTSPSPRD